MMTLYEMQKELNYYYNLKDSLTSIVKCYDNSVSNLEPAVDGMKTSYNVDGVSKGSLKLKKSLDKLEQHHDCIKNTIIPAINFEISELKKKIEEEQMKLT